MPDNYTPEFTADNLARINKALASGALSVEYADKKVTYQTTTDLLRLRELIKSELGLHKGRNLRVYSDDRKGL